MHVLACPHASFDGIPYRRLCFRCHRCHECLRSFIGVLVSSTVACYAVVVVGSGGWGDAKMRGVCCTSAGVMLSSKRSPRISINNPRPKKHPQRLMSVRCYGSSRTNVRCHSCVLACCACERAGCWGPCCDASGEMQKCGWSCRRRRSW
jgi:hypothetical protein